ncbi:MAG: creatininase family protein [Deltaproteobacteria bacterium]|nr:creatininase family protein [Deltaproteobacteria bacterium]
MPVVRAEELTYTKVRQLDGNRTVCFLPMSALEVHGPHLPLGMDHYMARWMAEETGRRFAERYPDWTVIQMPALPLGTDELPLAGSMEASQRTVYSALVAHGRSLARAGYKYVVVTNGHGGPRHAAALEAACRRVSRREGIHMFSPSILTLHRIITGQRFAQVEELLGRPLTDGERRGLLGGEHAGSWETAFMLAQQADLVEPDWQALGLLEPPKFKPLVALGERLAAWREKRGGDAGHMRMLVQSLAGGIGWLLNAKYGYGGPVASYKGDPSVASAAIGHAFREIMARDCLELLVEVVEGRTPASAVRSIASDPAIIQPQFWRRLGLAAAALIVVALLL